MIENKEILKQDVIEETYFLKTEDLINEMLVKGSVRVADIVLNKDLTLSEKFNYLKSQMLKEPNVKMDAVKNYLFAFKGYVVISELEVLNEKGFSVAKDLYILLSNDVDIENARKRLFNE